MKLNFQVVTTVGLLLASTSISNAVLIAAWNFNSLSIASAAAPGSGGVPTSISANSGTGTVGLSTWTGLVEDFGGSTINAVGSDPSERLSEKYVDSEF